MSYQNISHNNCAIFTGKVAITVNNLCKTIAEDFNIPYAYASTIISVINRKQPSIFSSYDTIPKTLGKLREYPIFDDVVEGKFKLVTRNAILKLAMPKVKVSPTGEVIEQKGKDKSWMTNDSVVYKNFLTEIANLKAKYGEDKVVKNEKTGVWTITDLSMHEADNLLSLFNSTANISSGINAAKWLSNPADKEQNVNYRNKKYNVAFLNLTYDKNYAPTDDSAEVTKSLRDIEKDSSLSSEEKEEKKMAYIIDNATNIICKASNSSSSGMYNLYSHFSDMNKLTYLSDVAISYMSNFINNIVSGNEKIMKYFHISERMTRKQVLSSTSTINSIIGGVRNIFELQYNTLIAAKNKGDSTIDNDIIEDLKVACENFQQLIVLSNRKLLTNEGITLSPDGTYSINLDSDNINIADSDENADITNDQDENSLQLQDNNGFKLSNPNVSISQKISTEVKILLSQLVDKNSNNLYGYRFACFLDVSKASNKLLNVLSDCYTYSDMIAKLKSLSNVYTWMGDLANRLELNTSESEMLRTKFFRAMRKEFNAMNVTYTVENSDGTVSILRKDLNSNSGERNLIKSIQEKFEATKNPLKFGGNTGIAEISVNNDELLSIQSLFKNSRETDEQASIRVNAEVRFIEKYLNKIGIAMSRDDLRYLLQPDYTNRRQDLYYDNSVFHDIFNYIQEINGFATDVNVAPMSNEFKAKVIANPFMKLPEISKFVPLKLRYENLIGRLYLNNSVSNREPVVFVNKKSYYSFNNPSSIGTMVSRLKESKTNADRFNEFMTEHFGSAFFIKGYNEDGSPIYYADWLNKLSSTGDKINEIFSVSFKLAYGEESYEKMSDKSTALSLLSDYYYDNSKYAFYRTLINSDKPKDTTLKFYKYNFFINDEKDKLRNSATDSFIQELNRAKRVVRDSLVINNNEKVYNYDISLTEELKQKIRDKQVTLQDVMKDIIVNGKVIDKSYIFEDSGASFHFNAFIDKLMVGVAKGDIADDGTRAFVKNIIDYIFNEKNTDDTNFNALKISFIPLFENNIDNISKELSTSYANLGIFELTSDNKYYKYLFNIINRNHPGQFNYLNRQNADGSINYFEATSDFLKAHPIEENQQLYLDDSNNLSALGIQRYYIDQDLKNYVYNNYIAKINIQQIFGGDPAFYGGTSTYQKRNSQQTSSGELLNKEATIHGKRVSDGKLRTITLKEKDKLSTAYVNIERALNNRIAELRVSGKNEEADNFDRIKGDILSKYKKIADTDGQAFTSLTAIRKKKAALGEWTTSETEEEDSIEAKIPANTDEAVYQRIIHRKALASDLEHTFTEPLKGFVHTTVNTTRNGENFAISTQHKNSEYMLANYIAFMTYQNDNEESHEAFNNSGALVGILNFMEMTARNGNQVGIQGVDTINFESGEKVGTTQAIEIDPDVSAAEAYNALYDACVDLDKGTYTSAVRSYNMDDYKIQQIVPEEFKGHKQPQGTQEKIISLSNLPSGTMLSIGSNHEQISSDDVRQEYFNLLDKKLNLYLDRLKKRFNLASTLYGTTEVQKKEALSYILKESLGNNQKYSADLKLTLSIVNGDFIGALDDESTGKNVENILMSIVRSAMYREKVPGGPVVQSTCWTNSNKYNIRFFNKNKNKEILLTEKEFKESNLPGSYKEYCKENQGDMAYYEVAVPLPNQIRDLLINKDTGSIDESFIDKTTMEFNFDAIKARMIEVLGKNEAEKALEGISYRIPTEARYSIANIKVVNFTSNWSGSAIIFPQDITTITGSDFDIDKSFIMMRDVAHTVHPTMDSSIDEENAINNRLFDIQAAAMRVGGTELESLNPGDFSDMSNYSYYMYLLANSNYDTDTVDYLYEHDTKTLKKLANKLENLDIMNPVTDVLLHRQNMQPLDVIGMAAVANINHNMVNMCGKDGDVSGITQKISAKNHFRVIEDMPEFLQNGKEVNDLTTSIEAGINEQTASIPLDSLYGFRHFLVTSQLCKYIGASADAAKDPALARLNVTPYTFPIVQILARWGFTNKLALAFICQPAIRQLVDVYEDNLSAGYGNSDNAIDLTERKLMDKYGITLKDQDAILDIYDVNNNISIDQRTLQYSQLINRIKAEKDLPKYFINQNSRIRTAQVDIMYLEMFRFLMHENEHLKSLCSYLRYNSVNAAEQKTYIEFMDKYNQIKEVKDSVESDNGSMYFDGLKDDNTGQFIFEKRFPNIATTLNSQRELVTSLIYNNMLSYHGFYEAAVSMLPDRLNTAEYKTKMKAQMKNYLLTRKYEISDKNGKLIMNPVIDLGNNTIYNYYNHKFAHKFKTILEEMQSNHADIYNKYLKNNSFLTSLHVIPKVSTNRNIEEYIIESDVNGLGADERQRLENDWSSLLNLNTGNERIDKEFKELALDLACYFMYRGNGFEYGPKSPYHLKPLKIELNLRNYNKAMKSQDFFATNKKDVQEFLTQFILNNSHSKTKCPTLTVHNIADLIRETDGKITTPSGKEYNFANFDELFKSSDNDGILTFNFSKLQKSNNRNLKRIFNQFIFYGGETGNDVFFNSIFRLENAASKEMIIFNECEDPNHIVPNILTDYKNINPKTTKINSVDVLNPQITSSTGDVRLEFHIVPTMGDENNSIDYRQGYNPSKAIDESLYAAEEDSLIEKSTTADVPQEEKNAALEEINIIRKVLDDAATMIGTDRNKIEESSDAIINNIIKQGVFKPLQLNTDKIKGFLKYEINKKLDKSNVCR